MILDWLSKRLIELGQCLEKRKKLQKLCLNTNLLLQLIQAFLLGTIVMIPSNQGSLTMQSIRPVLTLFLLFHLVSQIFYRQPQDNS